MTEVGSVVRVWSEKQASEQVSEAEEDEDHYRDDRRHQPHHVEKL
jgi:hypothetical protein